MLQPDFTWDQIMASALSFLNNPFVSGIIVSILALGLVVRIADAIKDIIS